MQTKNQMGWDYTNFWSPARLMKTADFAVESYLKQTPKLVNKKQLEVQVRGDRSIAQKPLEG